VVRWICDTPDRIPARVFLALAGFGWDATQCPCCSFWRGVVALAALECVLAGAVVLWRYG